jgi:hypothetical protein
MAWMIATPAGAAAWNLTELRCVDSPGADQRAQQDGHDDLWRTYYRSIGKVARLRPSALAARNAATLPAPSAAGGKDRHAASNRAASARSLARIHVTYHPSAILRSDAARTRTLRRLDRGLEARARNRATIARCGS